MKLFNISQDHKTNSFFRNSNLSTHYLHYMSLFLFFTIIQHVHSFQIFRHALSYKQTNKLNENNRKQTQWHWSRLYPICIKFPFCIFMDSQNQFFVKWWFILSCMKLCFVLILKSEKNMIKIINVISNLTRERYKKKGDNVESCYFPVYIILKKVKSIINI